MKYRAAGYKLVQPDCDGAFTHEITTWFANLISTLSHFSAVVSPSILLSATTAGVITANAGSGLPVDRICISPAVAIFNLVIPLDSSTVRSNPYQLSFYKRISCISVYPDTAPSA